MKLPKLRVDVGYLGSPNKREVGLVTHEHGEKPKHPTLFLAAFCDTLEDEAWFDEIVKALTQDSKPNK